MDQARIGFKQIQRWLKSRFHRNVYRWKVRQWVQTDKDISAAFSILGEDIFKHRWTAPAWSYIEPLKDAKTDDFMISTNQTSPRRLQSERGRDWDEVTSEIVDDNALLITKAMDKAGEVNGSYPNATPVTWQQILNPRGKGVAPEKEFKEEDDGSATNSDE